MGLDGRLSFTNGYSFLDGGEQDSPGPSDDPVSSDLLAGLEADGFPGRDCDLFSSAGVAPDAALARLDNEDPKSSQFNPFALLQGVL